LPRKLRCELLCEDLAQEQFFRPILESLFGRVRVAPRRPNGGFTFVLAQVPKAATYVHRHRQEAVGLLIAIDGDESGLRGRMDKIRKILEENGLDLRALEKRVAVCVPTRNIETWELWLQGRRDLDERTDYRREVKAIIDRKEPAAVWFAPLSEAQREEEAVRLPSLVHGRKEIDRLKRGAEKL